MRAAEKVSFAARIQMRRGCSSISSPRGHETTTATTGMTSSHAGRCAARADDRAPRQPPRRAYCDVAAAEWRTAHRVRIHTAT